MASCGHWPDIPAAERDQYDIGASKRWLCIFIRRFFKPSTIPVRVTTPIGCDSFRRSTWFGSGSSRVECLLQTTTGF